MTNSCGTTTYTWDARNRLVGIDGYKPDCSPLTASFKYDALGRRIQKTTTHTGTVTMYLYDRLDIVQEIENGVVSTNYIRTLNIDELLARIKTDGSIRYYQTDALGSVIALTDETGAVRTQYTYDPYGNVTITGEASDNPFQYTGRENDGTGLYYYRERYYNPKLQRFISEDPIGLIGGINLFTYVGNNPVNFVDSLGLAPHEAFIAQLAKMANKSLRRTIKSYMKVIERHEKALVDECQRQAIPKHEHELRVFKEQLKLAEQEAAKRGLLGVGFAESISEEEAEERTESWFDWLDPFLFPGMAY